MGSYLIAENVKMRNAEPSDHARIMSVMQTWWDERDLRAMLPKLFFLHFGDTSFILEKETELIGFLVGFLSQSRKNEACVHFVGVHPNFRQKGLGEALYERFFELCQGHNRAIVRACTSPVNKGSIEFHKRLGFQIEPGDGEIDGVPVTLNYNRAGDHKVLFIKELLK